MEKETFPWKMSRLLVRGSIRLDMDIKIPGCKMNNSRRYSFEYVIQLQI